MKYFLLSLSIFLGLVLILLPRLGSFNHQLVFAPSDYSSQILGVADNSSANKRIEVDLTNQKLYGFENDQKIFDFIISSGKWDRTPTGTFTIWSKVRSQKMSGGSKEDGTYYYLPKVPYILFFFNDKIKKIQGFSLHGTYWHHNFGVPMSHGCINMKTPDAAQIFNWAPNGTQITIYGQYVPKTATK